MKQKPDWPVEVEKEKQITEMGTNCKKRFFFISC
jgi:hypothetical protein